MLKIDNLILVFIPLSLGTGNCSASCVLQPGRSLPGDISVLGRSLPREVSAWGGLCSGEVSARGGLCPGEVSVLGRSLPGEVSAWGGLCMGEISVLEWPFPPPPSSPTPRAKPVTLGLNQSPLPLCQHLCSCSLKEGRPPWVAWQREIAFPCRPFQGLSRPAALRTKGQRHLSGMEVRTGEMPGPGLGDTSRRCYRNEGQLG